MTGATEPRGAAGRDAPSPAVVLVSGVDKTFQREGGSPTVALQGIDLEIHRGEFVSLIGPSGCGKSTLLRIGDLVSPSAGEVTVNGKPADRARRHRDYGIPARWSCSTSRTVEQERCAARVDGLRRRATDRLNARGRP